MPNPERRRFWKYVRGLAPPAIVLLGLVGGLAYALFSRVLVLQRSDQESLREWIEESRVFRKTLPELAADYLRSRNPTQAAELRQQLASLGEPLKAYQGQLPLFPVVFRIQIDFPASALPPVVWDSYQPYPQSRDGQQVKRLEFDLSDGPDGKAVLRLDYQLHAYSRQQRDQAAWQELARWLSGLGLAAAVLAALWIYFFLKRERERELQRLRAQRQVERAERLALENELKRREAEHRHQETERRLLEQRVSTQEVERQNLEMKSRLYAGIGIMAGSYAHNIKNLLVRPNDLLRRCLESDGLRPEQEHLLHEVRETLHTVTERLQQILKTVRRDPTRPEPAPLDLNALVSELEHGWREMALEKWKLALTVERSAGPLIVAGDRSHLMQAVENLLFNARDATFEMRNRVREEARRDPKLGDEERRQALIAAAAWQGRVVLRTRAENGMAVLEVGDNGIGMTEEVRRRCLEPHFTTKRDNALYEGNTTGMGLGLSFVQTILEHHRGEMGIESEPMRGTTLSLRLSLVAAS